MKIYVTGFHRAGTHSFAEHLARQHKVACVEESDIGLYDLKKAIDLTNSKIERKLFANSFVWHNPLLDAGFVCQCPGLAHEADKLSEYGKVYWLTRDYVGLVASMREALISETKRIINHFQRKWPSDLLWKQFRYKNVPTIGVCTLLIKLKEYFYKNRLKSYVERVSIEEISYYDKNKIKSIPLSNKEFKIMQQYLNYWEALWQQDKKSR